MGTQQNDTADDIEEIKAKLAEAGSAVVRKAEAQAKKLEETTEEKKES
jgi:hypothetical protein